MVEWKDDRRGMQETESDFFDKKTHILTKVNIGNIINW